MLFVKSKNSKKIVLLDRDGIINEDSPNYIKSVDEFIFLPGSIDAIVRLTKAGYQIGVATNQSGVSRGYYDERMLAAIHEKMLTQIRAAGGNIEAIEYCPHRPEEGCLCRKPKPGMLYTLAKRLNCSLTDVPFIGDKISDLDAALAAGAKPVMVVSSWTDKDTMRLSYSHVPVFDSLALCVEGLLADYL